MVRVAAPMGPAAKRQPVYDAASCSADGRVSDANRCRCRLKWARAGAETEHLHHLQIRSVRGALPRPGAFEDRNDCRYGLSSGNPKWSVKSRNLLLVTVYASKSSRRSIWNVFRYLVN